MAMLILYGHVNSLCTVIILCDNYVVLLVDCYHDTPLDEGGRCCSYRGTCGAKAQGTLPL